ncbi:hypothetical protein TrST_g7615 [Triparma strigata]|uniref:L domain-like protein n=1 Tax=Triparma strigata TaxID=1606541 RepID=A0A9W7EPW6_9STRA|nr:hypothetical protein TrST_g7615 [Triparma strigata]
MSIAGQLSSESLATTTTTSRPIVIERPHETTKRIAKERIAEKKETKQRFLERYEGGALRIFFTACEGKNWDVQSFFNKDYVPPDPEEMLEDKEEEDEYDEAFDKDHRRRGKGNAFRPTLLDQGTTRKQKRKTGAKLPGMGPLAERGKAEEDESDAEEGDRESSVGGESQSQESGGFDKPNIQLHDSVSTLGDPSIEGSIVDENNTAIAMSQIPGVGLEKEAMTGKDMAANIDKLGVMMIRNNGEEKKEGGLPPLGPRRGSVLGAPKGGPDLTDEETPSPEEWFGVKSIKRRVAKIDLHENNLVGILPGGPGTGIFPVSTAIPPEGDSHLLLGELRVLILFKNAIAGNIPASYDKFTKLTHLDLSHNMLEGDIPHGLFDIKTLKRVHLEHNGGLTGTIPDTICELENLEAFTTHYNKLVGDFPSEIGNCSKLVELSIHHNRHTGAIPASLVKVEGLKRLYLSNCHFEEPSEEFAKELLEAGKYEGDERVGYSRSFVLMPQWAEGESSEEEWDESEEESEMTIDGSQSLEVS